MAINYASSSKSDGEAAWMKATALVGPMLEVAWPIGPEPGLELKAAWLVGPELEATWSVVPESRLELEAAWTMH